MIANMSCCHEWVIFHMMIDMLVEVFWECHVCLHIIIATIVLYIMMCLLTYELNNVTMELYNDMVIELLY